VDLIGVTLRGKEHAVFSSLTRSELASAPGAAAAWVVALVVTVEGTVPAVAKALTLRAVVQVDLRVCAPLAEATARTAIWHVAPRVRHVQLGFAAIVNAIGPVAVAVPGFAVDGALARVASRLSVLSGANMAALSAILWIREELEVAAT